MPAEAGPRSVWSFGTAAIAGCSFVADTGLVATLPLSVSGSPKRSQIADAMKAGTRPSVVRAALVHTQNASPGPRQLDVCEWRCVSKGAGDQGRAVRQCPHLEVLSPGRIRSFYPKLRCGDETKADIETGIPEQGDKRLACGIGRPDDSVHERLTGTLPLTARQDADRSEPECLEYADPPASADDVADDLIVTLRNHRQSRDPSGIIAKRAEQTRLHRLSTTPGRPKAAEVTASTAARSSSVSRRMITSAF